MRKKLAGIVVAVMVLLLLQVSQAMADYDSSSKMYTYSYNSSGTWKTAGYKINYDSASTRYNPLDWVDYLNDSCPFGISGIMGTNCFGFVSFVLNQEGRGKIVAYTNNCRVYSNQTGGELINGCQWLNENHNGNGPSADDVKSIFQKAQVGDVVQMYWLDTPHTALISGFTNDGVYFFEANCFAEDRNADSTPSAPPYSSKDSNGVRVPNINNHYYSYSTLSSRYSGTNRGFSIYRFGNGGGDDPYPTPDPVEPKYPVSPGLLSLNSSRYAKTYTLTSGHYKVYKNPDLSVEDSSHYTGYDEEDYITGVGYNSSGEAYAQVQIPTSSGRLTVYVKLHDVFVQGTLTESKTAAHKSGGLYKRRSSEQNSGWYIDPGDTVYLLTEDNGWCQVMYPISGQSYWRIAWLTRSEYDYVVNQNPADNSNARDKVVAYAWEIYNFKWYASQPVLRHQGDYIGPRWIRGIPYTLYGTGDTFEQFKNLIDKNNEGVNNGLYDIVTYNIWTGESRTSMKHGMACATFVTTCIMQGFPNNAGLSMQPAIEFHTKNGWKDYVSVGSQSYDGYKRLQKGDYLDNFSSHVILVIDNHVGTGNGDSYIEYIDQTPVWDENNDIGTHKGTYYYSSLSSKGYRPMYVNYPGDSGGVQIDSAHFPDNYFREYVKNFDTNSDGYFSQSELDAVTEMWEENGPHPDNGNPNNGNYGYEWIKIESIEGIKLFRNLKSLCVYRDNIKEIDLSGMEHLERLYCYGNENDEGYGNRLTKLNLKNCTSLQELRCQNNQIKTLDLSGMDKLTLLWCWNNKIETLNLKGCKSLPELWARDNKLTSFNAEGCDSLKKAYLWNNSFTGFGQGSNYMPALEVLNLAGCSSMTGLNLTDYKNLKELHINDCSSLEWVDTSHSPNIENTVNTSGCNSLLTFDREPGVKVTGTAPTITTNSLPDAYVGKSYSATVSSSGTGSGNERIFFWIENGSDAHSNGFRLRNYKGNITGTPKQESNSMKITVRASNYVGETSKTFTVKVMPEITAPSITTTNLPDAYIGEAYNARITATGTTPITYQCTGATAISYGFLLDGKNFAYTSTNGLINGTITNPTSRSTPFTANINVTASNGGGSDSKALPVTLYNLPAITYTFMNGKTGQSYSNYVTVSGGKSPYTWTKQGGSFPDGLSMSPSGSSLYLKGTPTKAGTYNFSLKVTDANGKTATKSFTVTIASSAVAPSITTSSLPDGTVGTSYSATLSATGTTPITWTASGLPSGLSCSSSGTISGTPTEAGTFTVTIRAENSAGAYSKQLTLTVKAVKPSITTAAQLPNGAVKQAYSQNLTATGTAPITWTKTGGTLPAGLTLSNAGKISGTPTKAGTYSFTVKASNSAGNDTRTFSIVITATTISGSFSDGVKQHPYYPVVGMPYSQTITIGGLTSPCSWKISGILPTWLKLTYSGNKATLSGTPPNAGTYRFTLTATDKNKAAVTKSFTVTIAKATATGTLTASGGTAPYTWKSGGTIPTGLKLKYSGNKATLSGTPTEAGTFTFELTATDKNKVAVTKSFTVKITQPTISDSETFTDGIIKAKYTRSVTVSGGTAPYTWENSGTIPTGLKLTYSGAKATLSGTPTEAGTFTFELTATDKNKVAVTKSFTVKITQPTISDSETFTDGIIKAKYTRSVTVSGGTAPYTWENSGTIPTGLKLTYSGAKATLSGTPTEAGTFTFKLTATDKNKAAVTNSFTVKITKPAISRTFANGVVKAKYTGSVTVSGGTAPYTWKNSGTIPTGLKIKYSGNKATLSGTPTKAGTFTFKLTATDKNKAAVTKSFTVTITKPAISATFANGIVKAKYTSSVTVSGGTAPYTWKNSGTIPTGLKITYSGATATLSGTPTKAGTFTFKLTATDKNKAAVTKSFTVKITKPAMSGTFANGVVKAKYTSSVTVSGGTVPYTWKNSGTIPTGLKIKYSGNKATLSGTPTKAGTFTFKLTATDKNKAAVTKSFTVKITKPAISGTFANGVVKAKYTGSVTVSGGTAPYTWKNSGTIPTGLKIKYSGNKATLSGTPTKAGTFTFKLTATDKNKAAVTKSFTVTITKPAISGTFANGVVKAKYTGSVTVSGGTAPYTWKNSGTIPTGLKIKYSGNKATLSGTPTKAGTFTFKLTATDKNKAVVSKSFTVKITEAKSSGKSSSGNGATSLYAESLTGQADSVGETPQIPSSLTAQTGLAGTGDTAVNLSADLEIVSDDILESYEGRDSDLVKVRENTPLRFTVSNWGANVSGVTVYVDDKPVNITVSGGGLFTLPAEIVSGDFKVSAKAQSEAGEIETNELYIIAE